MATLNVEKLFVSKIIKEQDISEVVDIPPYFLTDEIYGPAYEFIRDYYYEIGSVPTERVFLSDFQDKSGRPVRIVDVDEPWEDIKQRIEKQYITAVLNENLDKFTEAFDAGDIDTAVNFLGMTLSKVHTAIPNSRDVDVSQNGAERLERYLERKNNPGTLVGVPTGFPTIDRATQGLQPGQLITLTGLAKASKSTLAMVMAMTIQEAGYRVLYLTYEQTVEEQERRLDAYRAGFNDNLLNSGNIDHDNWLKLQEAIKKTEELPAMMISQDCETLSAVRAKTEAFEADVVIIDGVYMMEDERGEAKGSPAALTNIVSGLKKLAMNKEKCIIAVTQSTPARTKGEELNFDSIMGSRSFIQYSNTVIGIERVPESSDMRRMKIMLSRSCVPCSIMLEFDYDTGTFLELPDFDMEDANDQELDNEEYSTQFAGGF